MSHINIGLALDLLDKWCLEEDRLTQTSTAQIEHFIAVSSLVMHARRMRTDDLIDLSADAYLQTQELFNRLTSKATP